MEHVAEEWAKHLAAIDHACGLTHNRLRHHSSPEMCSGGGNRKCGNKPEWLSTVNGRKSYWCQFHYEQLIPWSSPDGWTRMPNVKVSDGSGQ